MERPDDHPRGTKLSSRICVEYYLMLIKTQARQVKKCMTSHQECVSYEVLRREAKDTLDPADPSLGMYDKQTNERMRGKTEKKHKRERLIINPEFVESMDMGDGAEQFDADYNNEV